MRRDIYEAVTNVGIVALCAMTFGCAWAVAAPGGWGWYGAVIAVIGFCGVVLVALIRVLVYEEPSDISIYRKGGDEVLPSKRPSEHEVEELREAWWRRQDFIRPGSLAKPREP